MIRFLFLFLLSVLWGFSLNTYATLSEQQKQDLFIDSKKSTQKKKAFSSHQNKASITIQKKHHIASISSISSSSSPQERSTASHTTASHAAKSHTSASHTASAPHVSSASAITPNSDTSHDTIIPIHDPAPIVIEKSGQIADQGLEPPPETSSNTSHGLDWLFGTHHTSTHYRHLSYSVQRAIERAHVHRGRWKYIIVHNSGTRSGNARIFDIYHRRVRKMVHGLAYHFVIGNGHSSGDGEVEVGHRWTAQLNGGHVASDYLNDISLGICLVGDYNRDLPTKNQTAALQELITCLRLRVGKTQGHASTVCAHKEINPRPTDCPGKRFPYHWLHQSFGSYP
ncbi:MAG: peptidoglycan recognition family protein [Chthoniobacterales bacterium]